MRGNEDIFFMQRSYGTLPDLFWSIRSRKLRMDYSEAFYWHEIGTVSWISFSYIANDQIIQKYSNVVFAWNRCLFSHQEESRFSWRRIWIGDFFLLQEIHVERAESNKKIWRSILFWFLLFSSMLDTNYRSFKVVKQPIFNCDRIAQQRNIPIYRRSAYLHFTPIRLPSSNGFFIFLFSFVFNMLKCSGKV